MANTMEDVRRQIYMDFINEWKQNNPTATSQQQRQFCIDLAQELELYGKEVEY